ncbi:MAG TPA: hypothetical protein VNK95_16155 [Caldilineaceae bacterium]|nr:hypothetical protein [Caldilineaceae bacterium]
MRTNETKPTVIVVANRPRIFRELLHRALADSSERFQVLEVGLESDLSKTLRAIKADWLIVTTDDDHTLSNQVQSVLNAQPSLSAVAVSPDGNRVEVLEASRSGRARRVYHNISLAELVSVLSTTPYAVTS